MTKPKPKAKASAAAATAVDRWFHTAKPHKHIRCCTCRDWPDVIVATERFIQLRGEGQKQLSLRQFHREVLKTQLGYTVSYDTWMNHVRACCGIKD